MKLPTAEQLTAIDEIARVDDDVVRAALARVPPSWTLVQRYPAGAAFIRGGIQVIYTVQRYGDGRVWLHVSACGRRSEREFHLPSWEQLKRVKNDFIGPDRWAYQVLPPAAEYVNQNPYCLHLFGLLDGTPALPDFTWGMGTL